MSGVPKEIPDLGSVDQAPRQNPSYVPGAGFSTEDYYLWSRCDGSTTAKDIILMAGLGVEKSVDILAGLRRRGALLLGDETADSVTMHELDPKHLNAAGRRKRRTRAPDASAAESKAAAYLLDSLAVELDPLSPEEAAAMSSEIELGEDKRKIFLAVRRHYKTANYYQMLGVAEDANKKELKRAYFRLSKDIHPDRYYQKELGAFREWVSEIFESASRAFNTLSNSKRRRQYDLERTGGGAGSVRPQTPEEYAEELYSRACDAEIQGDTANALKLFAAALRVSPKAAYMRRAATCALRGSELSSAEEYARKAAELRPEDPSYARVLADVLRGARKLDEAEAVLAAALLLNSDNDKLMGDIKADLDRVRRDLRADG